MSVANIADVLRSGIHGKGYLPVTTRKEKLQKLKQVIQKKEVLISSALKKDLGKSDFESYLTETGFILEEISYVIKHIDSWTKNRKVRTPLNLFPAKSLLVPEPYGVVLIISPWNYPFQLCFSPLLGALAAGNKIVIKPSEFAPQTSKIIQEIIREVFLEDEVVVVEGGIEETQLLLKQKFDYIFFTGSTAVGKVIMKAAAEHLTPLTLELGGKSPLIIEESANLEMAAKRVVWGKFINAGQTCVAPDYVLIPDKLQETFLNKAKFYLEKFYGQKIESSKDYPRIINERHFDRLTQLITPHKVAVGGQFSKENKFIHPTIMKDVSWTDKVMEDEIFGPILPVIPYTNLKDALKEVVKRPKPLAFYLFTERNKVKEEVVKAVPFGGGCINDTVMHLANPYLPFGGVGASGIGSYHGKKSFDTFTHYKSILIQKTKVDIPLRYPPYAGKLNWLKLFLR